MRESKTRDRSSRRDHLVQITMFAYRSAFIITSDIYGISKRICRSQWNNVLPSHVGGGTVCSQTKWIWLIGQQRCQTTAAGGFTDGDTGPALVLGKFRHCIQLNALHSHKYTFMIYLTFFRYFEC